MKKSEKNFVQIGIGRGYNGLIIDILKKTWKKGHVSLNTCELSVTLTPIFGVINKYRRANGGWR